MDNVVVEDSHFSIDSDALISDDLPVEEIRMIQLAGATKNASINNVDLESSIGGSAISVHYGGQDGMEASLSDSVIKGFSTGVVYQVKAGKYCPATFDADCNYYCNEEGIVSPIVIESSDGSVDVSGISNNDIYYTTPEKDTTNYGPIDDTEITGEEHQSVSSSTNSLNLNVDVGSTIDIDAALSTGSISLKGTATSPLVTLIIQPITDHTTGNSMAFEVIFRGVDVDGVSVVGLKIDTPSGYYVSGATVSFYDDDWQFDSTQPVISTEGNMVLFQTTHNSYYVADVSFASTTPPWMADDEDDYVPQIPQTPVVESDNDDNTTLIACAAAAVVATLMAVFLIADRKR